MSESKQPLHFEDVEVGASLPRFERGPMSPMHLMRWSAAMENWHRIHFDQKFAVEHDKLPSILIAGSQKQQFLIHMIKDWVGRTGWVWKVNFQFRKMNVANETLFPWAKVTAKTQTPDYGLVELEVGILNDAGVESTPGKATVALPYKGGKPVPYPFVAPKAA